MRVQVGKRAVAADLYVYRLLEENGRLCVCWAPGLEPPDPEGPLDRGGFETRSDATAFALGVDRWRAEHGLIAVSVADIDRERAELDGYRGKVEDAPIDVQSLLQAIDEHADGPIVEYRRRVA